MQGKSLGDITKNKYLYHDAWVDKRYRYSIYSLSPLVRLVNLYKYMLKRRVPETFIVSVKINGPKNAQLERLNLAIELANSITVKQYA